MLLWIGLAFIGVFLTIFVPLPKEDFQQRSIQSLNVTDCNGELLREVLNDREGRGIWVPLDQISDCTKNAVIALEDRRFFYHPGVDPIAIGRAIIDNFRHGQARSGGSSITQQVIRNIYNHPRTIGYKVIEMWFALRLERVLSKREILEQYLNRAPFGNQLFGIEAASRYYFSKTAQELSPAEAAYLCALPNSPTTLNPIKHFSLPLARQRKALAKMLDHAFLDRETYDRAIAQPIVLNEQHKFFRAPHAVEIALSSVNNITRPADLKLTIDMSLQEKLESFVRDHLKTLEEKNATNAAVIVVENKTGNIRALIGSADYFDAIHQGQVNGALSLRQPGSALKPFLYALAFEEGISPSDLIADVPLALPDEKGDFIPQNYDRKFHGPVRARVALACSYNVPAVRVTRLVGIEQFLEKLRSAGLSALHESPQFYGYGLTLGNGDITLFELTRAYVVLANGGRYTPLTLLEPERIPNDQRAKQNELFPPSYHGEQIYSPRVSFLVTNILSDPAARRPAFGNAFRFPFQCAVKTGTTKDYRDNWTMGYTTEYTVGVWVGNFDGKPMQGVSGYSGAGPIFSDIMMYLVTRKGGSYPKDFAIPGSLKRVRICPRSGMLPNAYCRGTILEWYPSNALPKKHCSIHQPFRVVDAEGGEGLRVFEIFPPEYQDWVQAQRLPQPSVTENRFWNVQRSHGSASIFNRPLAITSPNQGDRFKLDPVLRKSYQSIQLVASIPPNIQDVAVMVDGSIEMPYAPGNTWWQMRRGTHSFLIVGKNGNRRIESRPISITVD